MGKNVYWVGGSKGGVGTSITAMALLDYLRAKSEPTLLVETDTANSDVWKCYGNLVASEVLDLDVADGWIHLVNTCHKQSEKTVVVNTTARNNTAVARFGQTLNNTLEDLQRELVVLWLINRQRDSLELLHSFHEAVPKAFIHVLRNGYFGEAPKFERYNGSKIREMIEARGGRSVLFPDLADRVADDLFTERLPIETALKDLPLGNRAALAR